MFRQHLGTLLCVVCGGDGFVFVSTTRVVSFHFDFWERGSLLLSTLLMMTVALAMLTYDDDHDKDEGADDDDHHDGAYIVLFLFCSFPFSPFPPLEASVFPRSLCRDVLHRIRGFQDALPHCLFVI